MPRSGMARYCRDDDELQKLMAHWRRGRTFRVGLAMGAFDLLHIGHLEYLERARSLCDALVVGVDSDARVRARKGPHRPFLSETERIAMLRHVRHVEAVILKRLESQRWALVRMINPDVLVVSQATYHASDLEILRAMCPKVAVIAQHPCASTSDPIRQARWRKTERQ